MTGRKNHYHCCGLIGAIQPNAYADCWGGAGCHLNAHDDDVANFAAFPHTDLSLWYNRRDSHDLPASVAKR